MKVRVCALQDTHVKCKVTGLSKGRVVQIQMLEFAIIAKSALMPTQAKRLTSPASMAVTMTVAKIVQ